MNLPGSAVSGMAALHLLALASMRMAGASTQIAGALAPHTNHREASNTNWSCPQHTKGSFPKQPWSSNADCVNVSFAGASG